jgi:hypothetical protein
VTDPNANAYMDRLQTDPAICGGQVCIKGTRIPVSLISFSSLSRRVLFSTRSISSDLPFLCTQSCLISFSFSTFGSFFI